MENMGKSFCGRRKTITIKSCLRHKNHKIDDVDQTTKCFLFGFVGKFFSLLASITFEREMKDENEGKSFSFGHIWLGRTVEILKRDPFGGLMERFHSNFMNFFWLELILCFVFRV
jgi:hypothetical protein